MERHVIRAVADSPFFQSMRKEDRADLARRGKLCEHGHGEVLFRPREVPKALYLVVGGVAEISRRETPDGEFEPVAYVGQGAVLAASKVITGTPFESLARFPEGGETLQWPRSLILRRIYQSPAFSMRYLQNLARRLEGGFANGGGRGGTKLGGRLDHFDLPTILQTVVDTGAIGVLQVVDAQGRTFGTVYTEHRQIGPMSCGGLSGPEAFLFRRFRSEVPGDAPLRLQGLQLQWCNAEDLDLIEQIWHALAVRAEGWESLARRLPYSRSQVAMAVRDLVRIGEVTVDVGDEVADGVL
jgi:CRP-like cAMP-binding protein